jgi:hypothetical protein
MRGVAALSCVAGIALAGTTFAALGLDVGSARARPTDVRELPVSTPLNPTFAPLTAGTTYRAGLVSPSPRVTPSVRGWVGAQFVSHQRGKVRYETAWFGWHGASGGEVDIVSGPAMTMSPAATIARPRRVIPNWNFTPYQPPGPVKRLVIAGLQALYFDGTVPPPGGWSLVGSNPPELRLDHDQSFRMAALGVREKTVVIVIQAPAADFPHFLPFAMRLLGSLRFPKGA